VIPDPFKKTVLIPVRVVEGELKFFYGGPLPSLKEGTIGDLTVPEYTVENDFKLDLIRNKLRKPFLKKGTVLLARLSKKSQNGNGLLKMVEVFPPTQGLYAFIKLEEDLEIELRGTKNPELCSCECSMPTLEGAEASSVNHAYTLLSEQFEKHRKTHTGNVFNLVYVQNKNQEWVRLKEFRNRVYRDFEYELICICKDWWTNGNISNNRIWSCIDSKSDNLFIVFEISGESKIVSEHYCNDENEAEHWLKSSGYRKFNHNDFTESLKPPAPPYNKPGGKEVVLTFGKIKR